MAVIINIFIRHRWKNPEINSWADLSDPYVFDPSSKLIFALHTALMDLKLNIVMLEWTGNWKNYIKVLKYTRGVLHWVQEASGNEQKLTVWKREQIAKVFKCPCCTARATVINAVRADDDSSSSNNPFWCQKELLAHIRQIIIGCESQPEYIIDFKCEYLEIQVDQVKRRLKKKGYSETLPVELPDKTVRNEIDEERLARLREFEPYDNRFYEELDWKERKSNIIQSKVGVVNKNKVGPFQVIFPVKGLHA
jgi:hypothetical protein